jgi:pSer/pThr/pTyr-binding forkhead associated (FHA) protein
LVELGGDKLRVTDLNSTNGTYIDDERVVGSAQLDVGSVLRVGNVLFEHQVCPRSKTSDGADISPVAKPMQPDIRRVAES